MKKNLKSLMTTLIILLSVNLALSQDDSKNNKLLISLASNDSVWIESNRNIEIRKYGGIGFFYPYNLPDAKNDAMALFRTYNTPINAGFAIIEVSDSIENLKTLIGSAKFSGSDIGQTRDTLIIAAYYSKTKDSLLIVNLNKGLIADKANIVKISTPLAQFESFRINLSESSNNNEERKYLIIQLIIKSGSDDNFYYGISNAVIDNLYLTHSEK